MLAAQGTVTVIFFLYSMSCSFVWNSLQSLFSQVLGFSKDLAEWGLESDVGVGGSGDFILFFCMDDLSWYYDFYTYNNKHVVLWGRTLINYPIIPCVSWPILKAQWCCGCSSNPDAMKEALWCVTVSSLDWQEGFQFRSFLFTEARHFL